MASNSDFVQYVADQCSGAGDITTKKMFGEYGIYCEGKIFGLICDDCFFLKPTDAGRQVIDQFQKECILRPPYPGAKDYFYMADIDDADFLVQEAGDFCFVFDCIYSVKVLRETSSFIKITKFIE